MEKSISLSCANKAEKSRFDFRFCYLGSEDGSNDLHNLAAAVAALFAVLLPTPANPSTDKSKHHPAGTRRITGHTKTAARCAYNEQKHRSNLLLRVYINIGRRYPFETHPSELSLKVINPQEEEKKEEREEGGWQ